MFLDHLYAEMVEAGIELLAWVVLPNHSHLLVYVAEGCRVKEVMGHLHGAMSHSWNLADQTRGRKVWCGYTDRYMRSPSHYLTTLNYIHYNAVKHGWVKSPYDWAESSVHWYLANFGREWLRDVWVRYPLKEYGKNWD